MPYRFVREKADYADLAAGQALYNLPGRPAFPVRLASEIFQRCLSIRAEAGIRSPLVLYDPCCGGGYLLTTLAFLHRSSLRAVIGSDADTEALRLAEKNLSLLTPSGMDARIAQIREMKEAFGKESHAHSLDSTIRLRASIEANSDTPFETRLFRADATDEAEIRAGIGSGIVDAVITDLPYGQRTRWIVTAEQSDRSPAWRLLNALLPLLPPNGIVAMASDKGQKPAHEKYRRADRFQIGKRRIEILAPL
jgi:hypothetical protein